MTYGRTLSPEEIDRARGHVRELVEFFQARQWSGRREIPVAAAARRLKLSRQRVYQLIDEGRLEAKRYSRRKTFVSVKSIEAYLGELDLVM
ncbi:MAG: helix-turn-helix domain-containing protein [Thermodesulfobacteriota bacterium]